MKWISIIFAYTDGYNRIMVNIYMRYNIILKIIKNIVISYI
nr:MAG TPA: hypothetical protein [Caudoviricetes sp.]